MNYRKTITFCFGIMVSILFIYVLLRGINFSAVAQIFEDTNIYFLIMSLILAVVDLYIRAYKWHFVLNKKTTRKNSFKSYFLGYCLNAIFPFRLGDIGRTFVTKKEIPIRSGLGAVVFERIFEGLTLVVFFAVALFFTPSKSVVLTHTFSVTLIVFFVAIVLIYIIVFFKDKIIMLLNKLRLSFLNNAISLIEAGFDGCKSISYIAGVVGLSLLMWFVSFFMFYFLFCAIGLAVPYYVIIFSVVMLNFAIILPSAPGGIGLVEYAIILTLGVFAIDYNVSLSFAILIRTLLTFQALLTVYLAGSKILLGFYREKS